MTAFVPPPESEVREILSEPVELTGGEPDRLVEMHLALEWAAEEESNGN